MNTFFNKLFLEKHLLKIGLSALLILATNQLMAHKLNQNLATTKITFLVDNATLVEIFESFEEQTPYRFVYDKNISATTTTYNYNVGETNLKKALDILEKDAQLKFHVVSKSISVTKNMTVVQRKEVKGVVTDELGLPLPGATVIEKGTTNGSSTDFEGKFSIILKHANPTLVISYLGYRAQEIEVDNQTSFNIELQPDAAALDEIVVIGYGSVSKSNLLGSVGSVKSEEIKELPVSGIDGAITGRVTGVQVVSNGVPGSSSEIRVRGIGSLTAGRSPLIVVDGYPLDEGSDLNAINPQDIGTIDVLKDAASTAIYGSRGSNGVILITTKSGKYGKPKITYSTYSGFQAVSNPIKLLDAYQFTLFSKEKRDWDYVNGDPDNRNFNDSEETRLLNGDRPFPEFWQPYLNGTPGLVNNDWFDDIFQDGIITNHDISVSGRNEKTNWYVSAGYYNQEGIIIGTGYKRYSAKFKLNTEVSNNLKFGINLTPSTSRTQYTVEGWNNSPISMAMLMQPYYTPYNDAGKLNISQQIRGRQRPGGGPASENPVATAKLRDDHEGKLRLFGNSFLEYEIIDGLKFKTLLGGDFDYYLRETFQPSTVGQYRVDANDAFPSASESTRERKTFLTENTLNYIRLFNKHSINAIVGYSYQKSKAKKSKIKAPKLDNDDIPNIAGTSVTTSSKAINPWVLISYFGRLQYNFDSKYLFSGSIRKDGSSRFGVDTKFGVFPAFSVGWNASNEGFFPKESFISQLKLRYSWGKSGNNQIGNFGAIATLGELNGYVDGQLSPGLYLNSSPNSDLSWESTNTNNMGVDIGIFKNKLNLSVDLFKSSTEDMLLKVPVPQQSGHSNSLQNIGEVENRGIEVILSTTNINLGQVKWSSSFNFSKIESEVLKLAVGQSQIITGTGVIRVGEPIGQVYGYISDGVFKTQAEVDAAPMGSDGLGQLKIVDVDKNNIIDANDRTVIGNALPDFTYGISNSFSYKAIDLNIFMDGVSGVDLFDSTASRTIDGEAWGNKQISYFNDRWHPDNNPNGNSPRSGGNTSRVYNSTYALQNASFFRIRKITLGYSLPKGIVDKIGLDNLRVYTTAKDPFLFTKYRGFSPEQSTSNPLNLTNTQGRYPLSKSIILGLNLIF